MDNQNLGETGEHPWKWVTSDPLITVYPSVNHFHCWRLRIQPYTSTGAHFYHSSWNQGHWCVMLAGDSIHIVTPSTRMLSWLNTKWIIASQLMELSRITEASRISRKWVSLPKISWPPLSNLELKSLIINFSSSPSKVGIFQQVIRGEVKIWTIQSCFYLF